MFNCIGSILDSSGYSSHCRNLVNSLAKFAKVRLSTNLTPGWERLVNDKELEMIKRNPDKDEINLIITNPIHWRIHTNAKRNWVYLVWEGDKIPKSWIEECLNPDIEYIFVPSEHTKKAIMQTNPPKGISFQEIDKKIKLIPHGVDLDLFYPKEKPKTTVFLANKGFRNMEDRGGIQYLIKAFCEEFNQEDAELIIKINPAYGTPNMEAIFPEMKGKKIKIMAGQMEYKDLVNFYNQGTILVSPARSEAFGIPNIEAMACGLPVITTNFGGQTDYVNEKNGWLIGGKLEEVKHELSYEGVKWLIPSIKELKEKLRYAYENPQEVEKRSQKALETAREYTWDATSKKIVDLI